MVLFVDLIEDVLLHIFSFLDPVDLYTVWGLKEEKLSPIVRVSLRRCCGSLLITGKECFPGFESIDGEINRLRIHSHWVRGECQETKIFDSDEFKHIGRVRMDAEHFYVSNKGQVRQYDRLLNGSISVDHCETFGDIDDPVISSMTVRGGQLFTGTYYGTCTYIRNGIRVLDNEKIHDSYKDILAMEFHSGKQMLASANFRELKLFNVTEESVVEMGVADWRARCLAPDKGCDQLVVGNVCTGFHDAEGFVRQLDALSVYDMATLQRRGLRCTSSGVVDMVWHSSNNVLLTGHWTGDLRVFDLRSDADELVIKKAGADDVNVSLEYDGRQGVVCGFRNSSEVSLYDLRRPTGAIRSFGKFKDDELATYLLDILVDSRRLYVVNFNEVRVCDFS